MGRLMDAANEERMARARGSHVLAQHPSEEVPLGAVVEGTRAEGTRPSELDGSMSMSRLRDGGAVTAPLLACGANNRAVDYSIARACLCVEVSAVMGNVS